MYLRNVHTELNVPILHQFIQDNPLGLLITSIPSTNHPTIQFTHVPWVLDVSNDTADRNLGILRGHLAKPNPHSKAMTEAVLTTSSSNGKLTQEVAVLFNGPAHHYVTPKFYTDTKPSTGKVVPTWNYSAVQAYGQATIYFDSKSSDTGAFLQRQITDLTRHTETTIMNYTGGKQQEAWEVSDAPDRFIELLKKNIIGIEIKIERLEGKFKMSQEMNKADRAGVVEGLELVSTYSGSEVARTVAERSVIRDAPKQALST